jgi:hypothetical protein
MRTFKNFVRDVATKPPVVMPFVGLAHVLWLVWAIWQNRFVPLHGVEWLQVLWMLAYTVSWIAACDLKKWGALCYILLTMLNVCLFLIMKNSYDRSVYTSNLFLLDGMFSFYLLLFYKRFS